jgi:hypothetical protein
MPAGTTHFSTRPIRLRPNYSVKWTAAAGSRIFMRIVAAATYLKC